MGIFNHIDDKLKRFSDRLSARLSKDRPGYPDAIRTFEERRIDWQNNNISKAIIIQPTFESIGVNSEIWNFINVAWCDDSISGRKLKQITILVDRADFKAIEDNIDELLRQSEMNLKSIKISDLKY